MKNKIQENKLRLLVKSILIKENSGGFLDGSDDPSFLKKIKKAQDHTLKDNTMKMAQGGGRKYHPGGSNKKKFTTDEIETILDALKDDEESDWYVGRNAYIEDEGYSQDQANRAADKEIKDDIEGNPKAYMKYLNENEGMFIDDDEWEKEMGRGQNEEIDYNMKWGSMDNEDKEDALLSIVKDPNDARLYINMSWDDLPDYISSNIERGGLLNETKDEGGVDIKQSIKVIKEWISDFGLDENEIQEEYKYLDNYLYGQTSISKKEFEEIWQHMVDMYGEGDIGADWEGFDEVWKDVQSGTLIHETKKEDKEEEEDIETPEQEKEETPDISTEDVNPDIKAVQDALTQAAATAAKLNDPKLVDQIGNTVTYFTRTHIVDAPKHQDEITENEEYDEKIFNNRYSLGNVDKTGDYQVELKQALSTLKSKLSSEGWEVIKDFIHGHSKGGYNRPNTIMKIAKNDGLTKTALRSYSNTELFGLIDSGDLVLNPDNNKYFLKTTSENLNENVTFKLWNKIK